MIEKAIGGINDAGRKLGGVNTQYSVQMICCRIIHLKPASFH